VLLYVVRMVRRCEDFGFVDVVYTNGLEYLFGSLLIDVIARGGDHMPGIQQSDQFVPWP
jgi:hypothetical protein